MVELSMTSRRRKNFGRIRNYLEIPDLIAIQRNSFARFLQAEGPISERRDDGLEAVFRSIFPIEDFAQTACLDYCFYTLEAPKYDVEECRQRDMTYAAPLMVTLRLLVFEKDKDTGARSIKDIKEQKVYMGDVPLMTENGTFVVNGTERVVVSQMHRSPGVFFDDDKGKTHSSGKLLYAGHIIPSRGAWLDIGFDARDIIYARIDRKRKLPVTTLLQALGMDGETILQHYYNVLRYTRVDDGWTLPLKDWKRHGVKLPRSVFDAANGELIIKPDTRITPRLLKRLEKSGVVHLLFDNEHLEGTYIADELIDQETGAIYAEAGDELNTDKITELLELGYREIGILDIDHVTIGPFIRNTMKADRAVNQDQAVGEIYRVMRPGDTPPLNSAYDFINNLFSDPEAYDLSAVGRAKMNMRLGFEVDDTLRTLRLDDIVKVLEILVDLRNGRGEVDDIDHLGNRRVRAVGELLERQYRTGLLRLVRGIRERMSSSEIDTIMPQDMINARSIVAASREFFGASQLSQFMDQTNPLSEVTHKRRLSALGPGGLNRERAGFEVRDVHPTHYGRICPIETPEGPNIGLINSLATYSRVNKYGFIETPYLKVIDGQIMPDKVVYLSALEESNYHIAQANVQVDDNNVIQDRDVPCRRGQEVLTTNPENLDLIDVSPKQLVSVASSLIPFLENDDANRALMGSNMMRQSVPLLSTEAPIVGTGMEAIVARASGATIAAKRSGIIEEVDAARIVIHADQETDPAKPGVDIYSLKKFSRSNQNTCINQTALVSKGDRIEEGQIIIDGPCTDRGELALGRNVLVGFMPWRGYNFEDSILISERMVYDDVFTSIHIEEFELSARDTKLGPEEITRDIPNVSEEAMRNLDEAGIVYIGATVRTGDILVGKITPKSESPMTPEEKLLRAIFAEKAADVRDSSLKVPAGVSGTVVGVRIFNRHGMDKDARAMTIETEAISSLAKDRDDEIKILNRNIVNRLDRLLHSRQALSGPEPIGDKSRRITSDHLSRIPMNLKWTIAVKNNALRKQIETLREQYDGAMKTVRQHFEAKVIKLRGGDDLAPGMTKMVKIYVAVKRKIQPGDKMAGRHGNKGVVSHIVPIEDMPYLDDGTPLDMVLNPLGVPSRMNVGQVLETHLGWASMGLGRKIGALAEEAARDAAATDRLREMFAYIDGAPVVDESDEATAELIARGTDYRHGVPVTTPIFDGARESDIVTMLEKAGLDSSGQEYLRDGLTGEYFDRKVTIGYIYMLKLHHLVDEKIHARSIGPYGLVTQQPLGGKSQFGGQRFGEMEVWALEAYGAAHTLQEILTVKSDDVAGRTKIYESIVKGDDSFEAGVPESFNVLIKEIQSLGLNVILESN